MPRTNRAAAKATAKQVKFTKETIQGTVLTDLHLVHYGNTGLAAVWVCEVDVGGSRHLTDVPVKAGSNGEHFFAQRNQTVLLRRNTGGRYEIIGPGDKRQGIANVKTYSLGITAPSASVTRGFSSVPVPFDFYEELDGGAPLGSFWNDGQNKFNLVQIKDEDGIVVG